MGQKVREGRMKKEGGRWWGQFGSWIKSRLASLGCYLLFITLSWLNDCLSEPSSLFLSKSPSLTLQEPWASPGCGEAACLGSQWQDHSHDDCPDWRGLEHRPLQCLQREENLYVFPLHLNSLSLFSFPRHQWVEKWHQAQGQKLSGFKITGLLL